MPVVEESVFIARPPQEVFDFIVVPANTPVWDSSITKAEQVGTDPIGLGTQAHGTSKIMGRHFDWTTEIVEYDVPTRLSQKSVGGKMDFTVTNSFVAEGTGTRLTYRIDAASGLGGVFGKLADPFVERAQGRTVRANLETLADLLAEHPNM